MPEKTAIKTSIGTLYVRHMYISDRQYFEIEDAEDRGRAVVLRLVGRESNKENDAPLSEEDLGALTITDFEALTPAIAKQNNWSYLLRAR